MPEYQPLPASDNDIQAAAWDADPRVHVVRRGLAEGALDSAFDVAIVFSGDTDLLPALELVFDRQLARLEVAMWSGRKPLWFPDFLRQNPPRRLPFCHFLNEQDFVECRDYSAAD